MCPRNSHEFHPGAWTAKNVTSLTFHLDGVTNQLMFIWKLALIAGRWQERTGIWFWHVFSHLTNYISFSRLPIKHWHYSFIKLDSHALPHEQEHGWEVSTRTCHKNNRLILCGASFKAQGTHLLCWYILTESIQNKPCVLSLMKPDIRSLLFLKSI